ncbi:uncharacterized protein (TIGR02001 family) [Actimicrobium sp. GrIS 1.19]|uniref:TorF family putative porin n=1 Tax=Actimicrobium sp. GrIS 1.19 TaxID=3071708 RepID=UPI002DF9A475|nr:uncharacterized protein (TIGR02001 family) [Actimicrobium sp. GrIS 1.19]
MKYLISTAALLIAAAFPAHAEDAPAAAPQALTFNAAITSDYRFRGISQSRLLPALQGGADYVDGANGWYVGTWLSSIRWTSDAGGSGHVEADIYGGKRGDLGGDFGYDVGVLTYVYPSNGLHPNANTTEVYGQLGYGVSTVKYSYAVTNLFGFVDSKRSGYLDISSNPVLSESLTLNLHVGHQTVKNQSTFSYTDWKIGVTKDFGVASLSLAAIGTDSDAYRGPGAASKNLGKNALVLSVAKTF